MTFLVLKPGNIVLIFPLLIYIFFSDEKTVSSVYPNYCDNMLDYYWQYDPGIVTLPPFYRPSAYFPLSHPLLPAIRTYRNCEYIIKFFLKPWFCSQRAMFVVFVQFLWMRMMKFSMAVVLAKGNGSGLVQFSQNYKGKAWRAGSKYKNILWNRIGSNWLLP